MGVFDYKVVDLEKLEVDKRETTLKELGNQMWKLVAVCSDVAYLARGPEATDLIQPDYGTSQDGKDNKNYKLEQPRDSRLYESISTQDGKDLHAHRVRVVILEDGSVGDAWVETVFDHTHDVKELGMLTKADGHTHTFDVNTGMEEEETTE
jgi:hypothetical protein